MTLDQAHHRLLVITQIPARLLVFDTNSGKTVQRLPTVGDCDDVFYDQTVNREGLPVTTIEKAISQLLEETGRVGVRF